MLDFVTTAPFLSLVFVVFVVFCLFFCFFCFWFFVGVFWGGGGFNLINYVSMGQLFILQQTQRLDLSIQVWSESNHNTFVKKIYFTINETSRKTAGCLLFTTE